MTTRTRWIVLGVLALLASAVVPASARAASPTGYEVAPVFQSFYERYGGVPTFGYAVSPPVTEHGRLVQYFERQRFEYHPELAGSGYEVLLGLVGREIAEREGRQLGPVAPLPGHRYVEETGHNIAPQFLNYWETRGGVRIFGYPVTEPFWDGGLLVQYFERARFEYHPELSGSGNEILLGRLGAIPWQERTRDAQYNEISLAQHLAVRINEARREAGLAPLILDSTLTQIAQIRSNDMAQRRYFSHTTPEGTTVFDLLAEWGVPWRYGGETIQRNNFPIDQTADEAARSLLASPAHRAVLLDARFTHFGVAEQVASDGIHYYTVVLVQR